MRKGALSISTNAIVVLIVAVIMLGLIIGLVTEGFNLVSDQFFNSIVENEPEAVEPTFQTPVTLSQVSKVGERGSPMGLKVKILNTQGTALDDAQPNVDCLNDGVVQELPLGDYTSETQQVFPKTIPVNGKGDFVYTFTVDQTAPSGEHLCRIKVLSPTLDDGNNVADRIEPSEFKVIIR